MYDHVFSRSIDIALILKLISATYQHKNLYVSNTVTVISSAVKNSSGKSALYMYIDIHVLL